MKIKHHHKTKEETHGKVSKFIYWTPRIVSILFIFFLALMSLDVFDGNYGFWDTIVGLFIHNIPAILLLIVLLISWKHEIVGGVVFTLAGVSYIIALFTSSKFEWYMLSWSVMIAGPAFVAGILFLICWYQKRKVHDYGE